MLRITRLPAAESETSLRLEGKLVGPWLEELRQVCQASTDAPAALVLDLSGVQFIDRASAEFLVELHGRGARITNGSPFVVELLKLPVKETS